MAFDQLLAERIRTLLKRRRGFTEMKLFGGIGFLLHGHMCIGIWKNSLIARVGPDAYKSSLSEFGAREFDITGRPMTGWVMIDAEGIATPADLRAWIDLAVRFVKTLPPKRALRKA